MIDPMSEQVISLTEAARSQPARRAGKRPHVSCLYRWTQVGCKGIKLEAIQIGGTRCTSREALGRFYDRLSQAAGLDQTPANFRTPAQRARDNKQADHELDQAGW